MLAAPLSKLFQNLSLSLVCLLVPALPVLADAVDYRNQVISIALTQEPPQLNSMLATDQISGFVLGHIQEGLLRYDADNRLAPAVAEHWELGAEGATFWLRQEARWSDGKPVTAHDFVFAWRNTVDPATGSEYASILYPLKNAEAINRGDQAVESLGVQALDDHTLEVRFEKPTPYFLGLTAFPSFFPVREDFYRSRGARYAADADDLLFNGPFKLSAWVHGASLRLEKNEHYWDRDRIRLNRIEVPYITSETRSLFNLFKDDKIVLAGLDSETLQDALKQRYPIRKFSDGSVFYLEFNHRPGHATANKALRQAIQAIYDPAELVNKVIALPGYRPGRSLFPLWLGGVERRFRQEYPAPVVQPDPEQAQRYLAQAKQELGVEALPPLVLLTDNSPGAAKQAEYLQSLFKTRLGLDLRIDRQTFKQRLAKMTAGDFDIVAAGWGPDFDDPITFGDLFASWNENNRGRYNNPEYDRWVRVAQTSSDPRQRMDAMARLQTIIIEDVVILAQYERGLVYVQHPRLEGLVRRVIGTDPDFSGARVIQP
ncbi:MAG: peptide ABC transporter substrate-binding protein [Oceanospirillaceae bacterium]|nr:peptide ABC transporter substrate-binding protein [Oceanospirillaceae bacterium]